MSTPICLFEDSHYARLFPLTLTRPVFDLRCGMLSLKEKIEHHVPGRPVHLLCRDHLAEVVLESYPDARINDLDAEACLFVNGRVLADEALMRRLQGREDRLFYLGDELVAARLSGTAAQKMRAVVQGPVDFGGIDAESVEARLMRYPWDLIHENPEELVADFARRGIEGRVEGEVSPHAVLLNPQQVYVAPEARVAAGAVLDAESGPIYVDRGAKIMANAVVEGPAFIGERSQIKIGAKIYEGTSIGEVCKIGGEVEESIVHGFSNKQHDGFLGHAYIGSWVNVGADTNNSDLKNNYGSVKVYINGAVVDSGSQFVGLFMGDHSKSGINTMFNTGTVVGAMCNVFGGGFPPKAIPSFSWGGADGFVAHDLEKALETARRVMARRDVAMTPAYEALMRFIHRQTEPERQAFLSDVAHS